jgi:hypothetical protein
LNEAPSNSGSPESSLRRFDAMRTATERHGTAADGGGSERMALP